MAHQRRRWQTFNPIIICAKVGHNRIPSVKGGLVMRHLLFLTVSVILTTGPCIGASPASVPIHVSETMGVARVAAPVTGGIPLPQGMLKEASAVRLLSPAGKDVPVQTAALARWTDGSVKWLLLDFTADVPANAVAAYCLEMGRAGKATPLRPIVVSESRHEISVDTGVLKLVVSRRHYNIIDAVWLDIDSDGAYEGGRAGRLRHRIGAEPD